MKNMEQKRAARYTIAIMLGDTQSDYSEDLLRGFYTCAKEENVNILFLMGPQTPQYCKDILSCSIDGDYNYQFETIYDYVHFTSVDALIVTYGSLSIFNNNQNKEKFLEQYQNIPYLLLEDTPDENDAPYLIADNYQGMRACVEHLVLQHGYRKVAFLSGPRSNKDAVERLDAYHDVMRENGILVTETMVAYGDYTEQVGRQIEYLLDENPHLEAIICANDTMAKACYRICAQRDLMIGSDIAITGFDDVDLARTLEPPLTSVSHSSFQFSYTALKKAIMLCKGKMPTSERMPATLRKRVSCGCPSAKLNTYTQIPPAQLRQFVIDCAVGVSADLLSGIPYKKDRDYYQALIEKYFTYVYETVIVQGGETFNMEHLIGMLKCFTSYPHISSVLVLEHFSDFFRVLASNAPDEQARRKIVSILSATQQHIHLNDVLKLEKEIVNSNRKAWFVPSFTRDLGISKENIESTMHNVMKRLQMMDVKSGSFYLFEKPILHHPGEALVLPEAMYLGAHFDETETVYYKELERPVITKAKGFSASAPNGHPYCMTAFVLFAGAEQYGLLICEVEQEDISFMQICSLQLGSLFRFLILHAQERRYRKELQNSLKVIEEKNHILSFVSEYDDLSELLNRRGFMERALAAVENHPGEKAYLLFGDLDHLKEINDSFGHAAGDFAIRSVAKRFRQCLPETAIIARIGGDEFVALVFIEDLGYKERIVRQFKEVSENFNAACERPYYIEISIGVHEFYCDVETDLDEIIDKSDELLYQAKLERRGSIKK